MKTTASIISGQQMMSIKVKQGILFTRQKEGIYFYSLLLNGHITGKNLLKLEVKAKTT